MSAKRRRTPRDVRRRTHGQNFLVDRRQIDRIIRSSEVQPHDLIIEVGAGRGALTLPLARAGARVMAVEPDPHWSKALRQRVEGAGLMDQVTVIRRDFRSLELPSEPYRVVSNPPFALTTALLSLLLDDPSRGPERADLLLQYEVARKRAEEPPSTLRSAAWAPWWSFELGARINREAFRPVPKVDAGLLTIRRRVPSVLPTWLAPRMRSLLRPGWAPDPT